MWIIDVLRRYYDKVLLGVLLCVLAYVLYDQTSALDRTHKMLAEVIKPPKLSKRQIPPLKPEALRLDVELQRERLWRPAYGDSPSIFDPPPYTTDGTEPLRLGLEPPSVPQQPPKNGPSAPKPSKEELALIHKIRLESRKVVKRLGIRFANLVAHDVYNKDSWEIAVDLRKGKRWKTHFMKIGDQLARRPYMIEDVRYERSTRHVDGVMVNVDRSQLLLSGAKGKQFALDRGKELVLTRTQPVLKYGEGIVRKEILPTRGLEFRLEDLKGRYEEYRVQLLRDREVVVHLLAKNERYQVTPERVSLIR